MYLHDIAAARAAFLERYDIEPNAILMDITSTTELADLTEQLGSLQRARTPGARTKTIMNMQIIESDIDGFLVARIL